MEKTTHKANISMLIASVLVVAGGIGAFGASAQEEPKDNANPEKTPAFTQALSEEELARFTELKESNDWDGVKAYAQELGLEKPNGMNNHHMMKDLSDDEKEMARTIHQQVMNGDITHEEAMTQLNAAGIELPMKAGMGEHKGHFMKDLTEGQQALAKEIHEAVKRGELNPKEAMLKLEAAEIKVPEDMKIFVENLTEEQMVIMKEVHSLMANGDITPKEARERLEDAEIKAPMGEFKADHKGHFMKTLTEEQQAEIKELKNSGDMEAVKDYMDAFSEQHHLEEEEEMIAESESE